MNLNPSDPLDRNRFPVRAWNRRSCSASLTENTRLVASSSGIVTDDGSVITGAAA